MANYEFVSRNHFPMRFSTHTHTLVHCIILLLFYMKADKEEKNPRRFQPGFTGSIMAFGAVNHPVGSLRAVGRRGCESQGRVECTLAATTIAYTYEPGKGYPWVHES